MTPAELAALNAYQQQQEREQGGFIDALGKTALAAGVLTGGALGARRLMRRLPPPAAKPEARMASTPGYEAVRRAASTQLQDNPLLTRSQTPPSPQSTAERMRRLEQITKEARAERMPGVIQTDLSTLVAQSATPQTLKVPASAVASVAPVQPSRVYTLIDELGLDLEQQRQARAVQQVESKEKALAKNILAEMRAEEAPPATTIASSDFLQQNLEQSGYVPTSTQKQQTALPIISDQSINAVNAAEDQQTGRVYQRLRNDPSVDLSEIEVLEEMAENNRRLMMEEADPSQMIGYEADSPVNQAAVQAGQEVPVDQAEGLRPLKAFDITQKQTFDVTPKQLGLQASTDDKLAQEAQEYLQRQMRSAEIDTDFDYSAENKIQAAQVRDRIQQASALQNEANRIIEEVRSEVQPSAQEFSAEAFNKQYLEELNPQLKLIDNIRQREELKQQQAATIGEDISSLLGGGAEPIEATMRGKALRGGKPSASGDVVYQGAAGEFASADTGLKTRQAQGEQFKERAQLLNQLRSASDEELAFQIQRGQRALANNEVISKLDADAFRFASQVLRDRALNNPEPTALQLQALERARASVDASQQALQAARGQKPTLPPGPQQDVARSMETLRRGMIVEPSEPLPVIPSVESLRSGFVVDMDPEEVKKLTPQQKLQLLGPVVSASDVYTGAAAEAAGPVIFTGKSKANTVLSSPPITGSIETPTGRYLTQSTPDVLGTTYNVAGTPANRAIAAQLEQQSQAFLRDAIAGGLAQKAQGAAETYQTPRAPYGPAAPSVQGPRIAPLGLTGPEASQRTGYAQYQPGRSTQTPLSPFIGEMSGGTVDVIAATQTPMTTRRDVGTPPKYVDLTRKGVAARYFPRQELPSFVTGIEPAPIGPLTQSPGLSRIGSWTERVVQGAGGVPVIQQTTQGQRIAYPRMDKPVSVPGYGTSVVTNIPRYGINPGAEDWREDLMRSEFRRGGPLRTYQG